MEQTEKGPVRIPLSLEVDANTDPISGRLTGPDGAGEDFVGWLALSAALERMTIAAAGRGPTGGRPALRGNDVNRAP
jgi:hypothetical protein